MLHFGREKYRVLKSNWKVFLATGCTRSREQLGNTGACFSECLIFPLEIWSSDFKRIGNQGGETFDKTPLSSYFRKRRISKENWNKKKTS